MSSEAILRFENISKNINRTEILKNINFEVEMGEVVGIIGKNGSGKTTLLKLASGLSYPTKGEIYFFDKKLEPGFVGRLPQNIGVLIETPSFISNLSGFDNLYYLSKIRNIISKDDITEIIEILPITKVPFLPEYMKGIINLRSTIIPVMDARMRFGMEPIEYSERTCIIIIENEANKIGLIVDAVNEVLTIPPKQIMESTKEKNDLKESFVNGISQINNDIQLILDCDSLVNIVGDMSNEINE